MNSPVADALQQIGITKGECIGLLDRLKSFSPPDKHNRYPDTFRLIATPMLYSIWERCFTLCHAIGLRLIRDMTEKVNDLDPTQRSVWLLQTEFYKSMISRLRDGFAADIKKAKKGHFGLLCEFLPRLDEWQLDELDHSISTDTLVMTFSNVNPDVVEINALAIGISEFPAFRNLKLGRLHDLVGQRNGIGHGAVIDPPSNDIFLNLLTFTEDLVRDYCTVFSEWIVARFPERSPDGLTLTTA